MAQRRPADRTPRRARACSRAGGSIVEPHDSAGGEIHDLAVVVHAEEAIGNERHAREPRRAVARCDRRKSRAESRVRATRYGTRSAQKLRIQFLCQCCDFSRPANRTDATLVVILEGLPAGLRHRRRRDRARPAPPPGRLRPRPPDGDRIRSRRHRLRRARRRNARRSGRDADREPRLDELAVHDALDGRVRRAGRRRPAARGARRSRGRGPVTPTSRAAPSTSATICATSSSAPARARPPRASPPAPSPASCSRTSGVRISSHVFTLGSITRAGSRARRLRAGERAARRCAAAVRGSGARAGDDRRDRSRARGRRHARRRVRGHRHRRARSASAATSSGIASSTDGSPRR